ncbi:MAG: hypothetical protein NTW86_19305 [Candidatus Sumerlaeota bacterium]|nr:hypothetical protein [Candidatus Sumerlaeota bacterium]
MALRRVLTILGLFILALLGLRGLIFVIPWHWPQEAYAAAAATVPRGVKILVWLVVLALPVGLFVEFLMNASRRGVLELPGQGGTRMLMRRDVIVKIVEQSVRTLPEVAKLEVSTRKGAKGLLLEIGVKAKAVGSVSELKAAIERRVDDSLKRILGIEAVEGVRIRLDDVSLKDRVAVSEEPEAEPPMPPAAAPLEDQPVSPPAGEPPIVLNKAAVEGEEGTGERL